MSARDIHFGCCSVQKPFIPGSAFVSDFGLQAKRLANAAKVERTCEKSFIVCAMLLLQYSWTLDGAGWRDLEGLYRGLTVIVLQFLHGFTGDDGDPFTSILVYNPRLYMEHYLEHAQGSSDVDGVLWHVLTCTRISLNQPDDTSDLIMPLKRLVTILSALSVGWERVGAEGLTLAVARCFFSWPKPLPDGFADLLKEERQRAVIAMLYYFATVPRLSVQRFWWTKERGAHMYQRILQTVGERCKECTSPGIAIFYFQVSA